jgi:hypothetical protein
MGAAKGAESCRPWCAIASSRLKHRLKRRLNRKARSIRLRLVQSCFSHRPAADMLRRVVWMAQLDGTVVGILKAHRMASLAHLDVTITFSSGPSVVLCPS